MNHQRSLAFARIVAVIGVLAAGWACSKKASQASSPPPASTPVARSNDDNSLAAGIELGGLDEAKRKIFEEVVNREPSACGKGHSLLHSVKHDGGCRASFYAVRYVARLAGAGLSATEITEKLDQRFRAARIPYIDVSQAPSKGAAGARVTIVEFADYECEHCKQAQSVLPKLLVDYPKDVTLYFKHFPLGGHVNALNAALGAAGAQLQGKFWQFSDKVWENSEHLTPALLEGIAKEIGLDFARWYNDLSTDAVRSHVLRDRTEGRSLEIHRTPAIFINGRQYTDEIDVRNLKDWIDEELGR